MIKNYDYYTELYPEEYPKELEEWYESVTGKRLDLDNPKTFNEKIQWLKLYDKNPLKTVLTDKYLVREWIKEKIGEQYLIPLLGVWDSFDDIDFDKLPDKFVLKTTHSSGWNIIVKDKNLLDINEAREKINFWMKRNYALNWGFELHYSDIKPRIIAEKYIENLNDLFDYKILCFHGKPKYIWVDSQRYVDHRRDFFDLSWNHLDIRQKYDNAEKTIPRPEKLEEMIQLAEFLSEGFCHVRVDFYEVDGRIYFGEMTFTSGSGSEELIPEKVNYELGNLMDITRDVVRKPLCPKVSVIIPVYNSEKYLRQCLDSVLQQSLKDIEIICVDDGSKDNSLKILHEYEAKDPRIMVIAQSNHGAGIARNNGLEYAHGEYIHFLDADDYLLENSYESLYTTAKKFDADIVRSRAKCFDDSTNEKIENQYFELNHIKKYNFNKKITVKDDFYILGNINVSPWGGITRRKLIKEYGIKFPNFVCVNDRAFYWECITRAETIVLDDSYTVSYRMNNQSSLIGNRDKNFASHFQSYNRIKDRLYYIANSTKREILEIELSDIVHWMNECMKKDNTSLDIIFQTESFIMNLDKSYWNDNISNCRWYQKYVSLKQKYIGNDIRFGISIIMPIYNAEKYLKTSLDSIIKQTFNNYELICINDGSTDGSGEILKEYALAYSNIRVFDQENQGAGIARNKGLELARGKYILFLDADDFYVPTMLEDVYEYSETNNTEITIFAVNLYREDENSISTAPWYCEKCYLPNEKIFSSNQIAKYVLNITPGNPWNKLFLKKFVETNNLKFGNTIYAEDSIFTHVALACADRISYLDKVLVYYRVNTETSLESTKEKAPLEIFVARQQRDKLFMKMPNREKLIQSSVNASIHNFERYLKLFKKESSKNKYIQGCKDVENFYHVLEQPSDYFYDVEKARKYKVLLMSDSYEDYLKRLENVGNIRNEKKSVFTKNVDQTHQHNQKSFSIKLVKKLKGGIKCYQEHGFVYTVKRSLYHLNRQINKL